VGLWRSSSDDDAVELVLLDRGLDIASAPFRAVGKVIIGTGDVADAFRVLDKSLAVNDGSDVDASPADENAYLWTFLVVIFVVLYHNILSFHDDR